MGTGPATGRRPLGELESLLRPETFARRVASAQAEGEQLAEVMVRVRAGETRRSAVVEALPGRSVDTLLRRLALFHGGGWEALVDRRVPPAQGTKLSEKVLDTVRTLLHANPRLGSEALCKSVEALLSVTISGSTMRRALKKHGLSRPRGRPRGSREVRRQPECERTPVPLAGAELLKAVELEIGAVRHLTARMKAYLGDLPAPSGEGADDTGHRDERGRFLPSYNEARERAEPEVGAKFESVERHRGEKDLRTMRTAAHEFPVLYRKNLAFTMLPVVCDGPRWSALRHWQGDHLGELVGYPYMPATLDKYARELKLAGAAEVAKEAVATFWTRQEGPVKDAMTGAVMAFVDGSTKPVWTRTFSKCVKVTGNGRVMPGTSTVYLHSGAGTGVIYRAFSGTGSVPGQVVEFLKQYEQLVGAGTLARVVVVDREAHQVALFKALKPTGWEFIVPLKSTVTGPKARFEDLQPWVGFGSTGDEVRDGYLWLNDSRKDEDPLRVRVVARKRHRTGKVAWYATLAKRDLFPPVDVVRMYFARWPGQEHRFRAGNGRVGLDVHHGYGKKKVTDMAVVTKLEELDALLGRHEARLASATGERDQFAAKLAEWTEAETDLRAGATEASDRVAAMLTARDTDRTELSEAHATQRTFHRWLDEAQGQRHESDKQHQRAATRVEMHTNRRDNAQVRRDKLARRTEIFTIDVELDEIMTAFKLTFLNLATYFMVTFLGTKMEIDALIRGVLTLPGERVLTRTTETVRIYDQPRDAQTMAQVRTACERLTARGLVRDKRTLRFEVVDRPAP